MTGTLFKTPLHALHVELGGKMVPFAGYDMPVQYPLGIMGEHKHTREKAGLFDVSHMGQARYIGDEAALEALLTADLSAISAGEQKYTLLLNETGGIRDDLMVSRPDGEGIFLVVNAATKDNDFALIENATKGKGTLTRIEDRALLALQGPAAKDVMERLCPDACKMVFMQCGAFTLDGAHVLISRSGYTGEDGFEISMPASHAPDLASAIAADADVTLAGLGARDTLRLEAGLPLWGHELDESITPIAAGLRFALSKRRREAGDFPGAATIMAEWNNGTARILTGLLPQSGRPVRDGAKLALDGKTVGAVTSGGFAPTLDAPAALGFVDAGLAAPGTNLMAVVRGRETPVVTAALPLVPHRYVRN